MYKNLKAEMIRQNVTVEQIAAALEVKPRTVWLKLRGTTSITISDCKKIAELFNENNSISYLFDVKL